MGGYVVLKIGDMPGLGACNAGENSEESRERSDLFCDFQIMNSSNSQSRDSLELHLDRLAVGGVGLEELALREPKHSGQHVGRE